MKSLGQSIIGSVTTIKKLKTNVNIKNFRRNYPFLIPDNINFENSNYNNINIDPIAVNRASDTVEEGDYESVYFEEVFQKR